MKTETLEPCPFCGNSVAHLYHAHPYAYYVSCGWCNCETAAFGTEKEATEAWNTRAERTCEPVDVYGVGVLDCGACGVQIANFDEPIPNYCYNCGAKVVGHETENMSDKNISRTRVVE